MAILRYLTSLLVLLPLLTLTSCYEDVSLNGDSKSVLCMNSLITAGEPIEVELTRTWFFTDTVARNRHKVDDAVISIFCNGILQGDDYIPAEGDHIRIIAESSKYGTAEAEVTVPERVPLEIIRVSIEPQDFSDSSWHQLWFTLKFNLKAEILVKDQAHKENYYHFDYAPWTTEYNNSRQDDDTNKNSWFSTKLSSGTIQYEYEPLFSEHIGVFESVAGGDIMGFNFFTDRQFQGRNYPLHISMENCFFETRCRSVNYDQFDCGFDCTISSISESFYKWANYIWHDDNGTLGELGGIGMSDPIWGYSNVSTGAGVVAARSISKCRINLKDCLLKTLKDYVDLDEWKNMQE